MYIVDMVGSSLCKGLQVILVQRLIFFTRDSVAIARICYGNSVCLSVCHTVTHTRVDQPKTVEARITQFSPYSSPIPLVFRR